jgi:hypothetical protein
MIRSSRERLRADRRQPVFDLLGDRGLDVAVGHALGYDQDERLGPVFLRSQLRQKRRECQPDCKRHE